MFERANAINWKDLSHSHGSAEGVPTHLDGLLARSVERRRASLDYFWEFMLHQGSRYQASPYVVPFLFEALEAENCRCHRELIDLLLALAVGYGEGFLPFGYDVAEEERKFRNKVWHGLYDYEDARSTYYEVHSRAETFVKYIDPAIDFETRLSAGFAIAHFAQPLRHHYGMVRRLIETERDPVQLQGQILCLGMLGRFAEAEANADHLARYLGESQPGEMRLAAAIAMATMLRSAASEDAVRILLTSLEECWKLTAPRDDYRWWNEGDLIGYAAQALRLLDQKYRSVAAKAICRALSQLEVCTFSMPYALLDLLFPGPNQEEGLKVSEFDELQRASLRILLRTGHWRDWMISMRFLPRGLTGESYRQALQDFVLEVTGGSGLAEGAVASARAGNVSSWDFSKHWPKA